MDYAARRFASRASESTVALLARALHLQPAARTSAYPQMATTLSAPAPSRPYMSSPCQMLEPRSQAQVQQMSGRNDHAPVDHARPSVSSSILQPSASACSGSGLLCPSRSLHLHCHTGITTQGGAYQPPVLDCPYLCLSRGCRHKARAHPAQTRQFIIQIMIHISLQPSPALRLTTVLLLPVWDGIEARQSLTKASLSSSRGRPSLSQKFSNCVQHLLAAMLHIIKPVANNTKSSLIENWHTSLL